ncbi:serine protease [Pseudomonas sp. MYb118]|uniref:serine protease n=1 Tax=Pseudomonas sp. MYb118 TaxID=1848720 RepID=UPI0034CF4553
MKKEYLLIPLITLTLSATVHAKDLGEGLANESDAVLLKNADNRYKHWNGVGKMFLDDVPGCTASLLDTRDYANRATGPAYLLTAAHCIPGVSGPKPSGQYKESVKFNYFNDTYSTSKSYAIKSAVWQDYDNSDIALYELEVPLATLIADGITPLRLASQWAEVSTDVLIVNAPEHLPDSGLRLAACAQQYTSADLVEGDRVYVGALKNRCRQVLPGSSGSPVLDRLSGQILAVVATSTGGASVENRCDNNAPCEARNGKIKWFADTHYSHPADYLAGCFRKGAFTKVANACTAGYGFPIAHLEYFPTQYLVMPASATDPAPTISTEFLVRTPYYRYKTAREARDCWSSRQYSGVISANKTVLDAPVARDPGMHYLCVVGVKSVNQKPDAALMKSAWITPAQLVERTPVTLP